MKKGKELEKIRKKVLNCKKCPLYKTRVLPVIGEGNDNAEIMFVGEAPGLSEAKTGHPFCGTAGRILDKLFNSVGIKRKDIYITSLLKDQPPNNRDPKKEEITACSPFLEKQIEIIKPKVICPLGRYSMQFLMKKFGLGDKIEQISKIHGKVFSSSIFLKTIQIIPLYHPAAALYNPNVRKILEKDFKIFKKFTDIIK